MKNTCYKTGLNLSSKSFLGMWTTYVILCHWYLKIHFYTKKKKKIQTQNIKIDLSFLQAVISEFFMLGLLPLNTEYMKLILLKQQQQVRTQYKIWHGEESYKPCS